MFGEKHRQLVRWLANDWWITGPPVCVISGFPGTGKTEIALQAMDELARERADLKVARFNCVLNASGQADDLLLKMAEELRAGGDSELLDRLEKGEDVFSIFSRCLVPPRLIVADEAQLLLIGATNRAPDAIVAFLERWSQTTGAEGRLLLLSSREFESARWNARMEFKRLDPLELEEAKSFLDHLLDMDGRGDAIGKHRADDIVSWLGRNPRAIKLFVRELARNTLDELIGLAPEAWEARYRDVSPELLGRLEEAIFRRAEEGLNSQARVFLRRISVLRQPADFKALQALGPDIEDVSSLRDELIGRYMLDLRRNYYEMHPVLRDTLRSQMTAAERRRAHLAAGRHYAAPFRALRALGTAERLGARFVEARYHFTLAESEADLDDISRRFEAHYRARFNIVTPVPNDPTELDERITLLSALLQARGAKGLEYHLTKCLLARNRPGDVGRALPHARRATGPQSPYDAWLLRMRVEAREFGAAQAAQVAREALDLLPDEQKHPVFQLAAQLLAQEGKTSEALDLLYKGIARLKSDGGVQSLYQAAGEMLAHIGREDEGVALLRKGFTVVRAEHNVVCLYEACGEILARQGKPKEALTELLKGMKAVQGEHNLNVLYLAAARVLQQFKHKSEVLELLQEASTASEPKPDRNRLNLLALRIVSLMEERGARAAEEPPASGQENEGVTESETPADLAEATLGTQTSYGFGEMSRFDPNRVVLAMRPDRWFGLYVVGCYDRIKTLYVQQSRALTLVHSLFGVGELMPGSKVGVIGGGAAGVTAAAAAARKGAEVVLFEQASHLLSLQRQNTTRYLHPHILDWPAPGSTRADAGLPLLNWHAGMSNDVARQIEAGFEAIRSASGKIDVRLGASVHDVAPVDAAGERRRVQIVAAEGGSTEIVDVAIVAVGFGVEPQTRLGVPTVSYWQDDGLEQGLAAGPGQPLRILVSGSGDSALIDVMRASLTDFRHDKLLEILPDGSELGKVMADLVAIEAAERRSHILSGSSLSNLQAQYAATTLPKEFSEKLRAAARTDTDVWFNFTAAGLYNINSSILNRFIVSQLVKLGIIKPKLGRIGSQLIRVTPQGKYGVTWARASSEQVFDRIILRHGPPDDFLADTFPPLADVCAPLRGKLRDLDLAGTLDVATQRFFA